MVYNNRDKSSDAVVSISLALVSGLLMSHKTIANIATLLL